MVYNFVVAFMFILVSTFSYWYSSKLTVYRESSFFKSFFLTITSYSLAGSFKLISQDLIGYYSILLMFSALFTIQTFMGYLIFRESFKKSLLTSILAFIVTLIIGLPLLVLSGIGISYLKLQK